jgi:hypothetical protein
MIEESKFLKLGAFNRHVFADAAPGRAFTAVEDDFHHFHAEIAHDGTRVTAVRGESIRYPWTACPEARERLAQFVGLPLDAFSTGIDASWQCTHLYELVRLAIAQARRHVAAGGEGSTRRLYEIRMPDRVARRSRAEIRRDGALVFAWDIEGKYIVAPEAFTGFDIYGRGRWPEGLDADQLEAANLLRRGAWLAIARGIYAPTAEGIGQPGGIKFKRNNPPPSACYSYQPETQARATSLRDRSRKDFTDNPEVLLAELERPPRPVYLLQSA